MKSAMGQLDILQNRNRELEKALEEETQKHIKNPRISKKYRGAQK